MNINTRTMPTTLAELIRKGKESLFPAIPRLNLGMATCGRAAGATEIYGELQKKFKIPEDLLLKEVGCIGACYAEPLVDLRLPSGEHLFYGHLDARSLTHLSKSIGGSISSHHLLAIFQEEKDFSGINSLKLIEAPDKDFADFLAFQSRIVTSACGIIEPTNIEEYVAIGGYEALSKALFSYRPQEIIEIIEESGLRGRGGAGFPTGKKWRLASLAEGEERFIVANADEGDPGAYMDRDLLESDPHKVIEGMIIAGYAIGAQKGYIFIRHEYPLAVKIVSQAIDEARKHGILGKNILESGFDFEIFLTESAGAFVCGEETSMLKVMEGCRGEPKPRPPYPATSGLFSLPTLVNNVETLANIPFILNKGPAAFRLLGTTKSPGTKVFCLTGDIPHMGFIEVPLGINIKTLVEEIGGREKTDPPKAIQIGGPSGGIIPYTDFALDYETVTSQGAIMGSGGLVVLSQSRCLVDLSRHLLSFMVFESCGRCLACREGLKEIESNLIALTEGKGEENTLSELEELADFTINASLCGLGKTAVNPLVTSLKYFKEEYEAHLQGVCPAVSCKELIRFEVIPHMCSSCRCCFPTCPTRAIRGKFGKAHQVDQKLCIKCWACLETCPYGAIKIISGEYEWKPALKSK